MKIVTDFFKIFFMCNMFFFVTRDNIIKKKRLDEEFGL